MTPLCFLLNPTNFTINSNRLFSLNFLKLFLEKKSENIPENQEIIIWIFLIFCLFFELIFIYCSSI